MILVSPGGGFCYFTIKPMQKPTVPNLGSAGPAKFIREVSSELKKVSWPTRHEAIKLTVVVLAISILVGVFIGGTDALFLTLQQLFLSN